MGLALQYKHPRLSYLCMVFYHFPFAHFSDHDKFDPDGDSDLDEDEGALCRVTQCEGLCDGTMPITPGEMGGELLCADCQHYTRVCWKGARRQM